MLNTDHLLTFMAVAETGSFTAAATRLGFTQPAVSQHIKALEAQVGEVRLFRRVGKTMRLTHAGEELLVHARDVVAMATRAEQHMLSLRGHVTGRVGIGCAPTTGERIIPALLAAFHGKHPGVRFAVDVGLSDQLLAWLGSGQVQTVLLDEHPRRRTFDVLELGDEPIVCTVARGHSLLQQSQVLLSDLRECALILPQRGMALRRALEDLFRRQGIALDQLQVLLETDSMAGTVQAVSDGLGLAFVPRSRFPKTRDLATIEIEGLALSQSWYLVRQRGGTVNRAVEELWDFADSPAGRKVLTRLGLSASQLAASS
ncbi:MAG TPA: LysR family transcriptional regulator [Herpetosiphonaceae bacterium]